MSTEIILCPEGHKLRVPTEQGTLVVTCPTCRKRFEWSPRDFMEDAKSTLDALFQDARSYRSSKAFRDLMEFIRRFRSHAPYNCFLLHTQRPGVHYVANARDWRRKFNRTPKEEARPLVILMPFGPVDFVYDAADTEGDPLPQQITAPFAATGSVPEAVWQQTLANAAKELVCVREFEQAAGAAGRITPQVSADDLVTLQRKRDGKRREETVRARYRLVLNNSYERSAKYATLAHELAHLYCGHVGTPDPKWWPDRRNLDKNQVEFEAESVCYIVCELLGIKSESAAYLSGYLDSHSEIPQVSVEMILNVAGAIERMGQGRAPARDYSDVLGE